MRYFIELTESNDRKCWMNPDKIIRIREDENERIIYTGTENIFVKETVGEIERKIFAVEGKKKEYR